MLKTTTLWGKIAIFLLSASALNTAKTLTKMPEMKPHHRILSKRGNQQYSVRKRTWPPPLTSSFIIASKIFYSFECVFSLSLPGKTYSWNVILETFLLGMLLQTFTPVVIDNDSAPRGETKTKTVCVRPKDSLCGDSHRILAISGLALFYFYPHIGGVACQTGVCLIEISALFLRARRNMQKALKLSKKKSFFCKSLLSAFQGLSVPSVLIGHCLWKNLYKPYFIPK